VARSIAAVSGSSGRNRGVLLLAAVFGILSAVLIFAFLKAGDGSSSNVNDAINAGAGAESVVVLSRDVLAGEEITSDMLTTKTVPATALLPGHSTNTQDFVGKVAVQSMYAGEQVLSAKVSGFEGEATLTWQVPEGMRGLGLVVPHEAWIIGGLPQPGDRVDVVGITAFRVTDPLTGDEKPELRTSKCSPWGRRWSSESHAVTQAPLKVRQSAPQRTARWSWTRPLAKARSRSRWL
jgi:Flp pilus assembly protein CpaB